MSRDPFGPATGFGEYVVRCTHNRQGYMQELTAPAFTFSCHFGPRTSRAGMA